MNCLRSTILPIVSALAFVFLLATAVGLGQLHSSEKDPSQLTRVGFGPHLPSTVSAAAGCEWLRYDNAQGSVYLWQNPDDYGDSLYNVRFSPTFSCTLKTVKFVVWSDTAYLRGTPGARVRIYSSDGTYPTEPITYVEVPWASLALHPDTNVVDFSGFNLVFRDDFHVAIQRLGTAADTLALVSDTTTAGVGRSGEYYQGAWELMVDGWGVDVNHIIRAELCCADCPVILTGDADTSGALTAADVIRLVNYVFKSGLPPEPCVAAGDTNCDEAVTAADVINLVNRVFKSGPAPCDVCALIPGFWTCP